MTSLNKKQVKKLIKKAVRKIVLSKAWELYKTDDGEEKRKKIIKPQIIKQKKRKYVFIQMGNNKQDFCNQEKGSNNSYQHIMGLINKGGDNEYKKKFTKFCKTRIIVKATDHFSDN